MIYLIRFLSSSAWSCFYPFMAVWLHGVVGLTSSSASVVVGFAIVANRVGALVFYGVLDKVSHRYEIIFSLFLMALFASLMLASAHLKITNIAIWIVIVSLFGISNSVSTISQISYIVHNFKEGMHEKALAYENVAANAGSGIAPFVASILLTFSGSLFAALPVGLGVVAACCAYYLHNSRLVHKRDTKTANINSTFTQLRDRALIIFMVINFLTMIGYAQFYYVFPTYATEQFSSETVGQLFLLASAIIIIAQVPITSFFQRVTKLWRVIISNLLIASGVLLLSNSSGGQFSLYIVVPLIVIGEMICGPLYQAQAVKIWSGSSSTIMSIQTCIWGAAEALAAVAGLLLVAHGGGVASFIIGGGACILVTFTAWMSISSKKAIIGINLTEK
uniref:Major facilitator superfamily MFS_1 n=1 Tax=Marinomonas sp. (strain MWYL1) TaxID=400668 RepID=A6VRK5_MARMS